MYAKAKDMMVVKKLLKAFLQGPKFWKLFNVTKAQLVPEWKIDLGPETRVLVKKHIAMQGCIKESLKEIHVDHTSNPYNARNKLWKSLAELYLEHQEFIKGAEQKLVHVVDVHWAGGVRVMIYAKWAGRGADFVKSVYHHLIQQYNEKEVQKLYMLKAHEEFVE